MTLTELRGLALVEGLSDGQLQELWDAGDELTFQPGDVLFRAGEPADYWWLLLEGDVSLVRHTGHEDTVVGSMTNPGQWAGGFRAWDPQGVYMATGRAAATSRLLRVPADRLGDRARAWFSFGVHFITGLMQTVRNIESTVRQREALVALGTLAAGLAHEINNPASAASRAADGLNETCAAVMTSLRDLAETGISAAQFVQLDALRQRLEPSATDDPLAMADREDELSDWLRDHDVAEEWLVAATLASVDVDVAWCEELAEVTGDEALQPALHWIASSVATAGLLAEVKESTRRVSSLVAAVRAYSQLDRASLQRTDIVEGIESTLMVLSHQLAGVTVVRDYGEVPQIEAIAGELNQVWTNLVDNAVDAMDGAGTLRVTVRATADEVVVEIGDTGPGVPDDVLPRVFEPFFTTKEVGHGTGLGLDISRRIVVDRHGGDIEIERVDGETVFRVRLPIGARPG